MFQSLNYHQQIPSSLEKSNVLVFKTMRAKGDNKLYKIGDFKVDPTHRKLITAEGKTVALTPKTFDLLLVLIESEGRVVTKDEIMSTIWHDAFVEEANLVQTISMLRKALGETRGENRFIITVPGRGYRFVVQVEEVSDEEVKEETTAQESTLIPVDEQNEFVPDKETEIKPAINKRKWMLPVAVIFGVALISVLAWAFVTRSKEPKSAREVKSIAVLPFKNIGGKADEDYLGQGLSEVLITKLSNIKTIIVRPTSAVMKYTDASPDPKKIGSELDVEAVVIGRVQKIDEKIRVTVQLIRVSDGATLWAETFDDKFTNIFAVQDSISRQVAESLSITLTTGEQQQLAKRFTTDTEAFQLYLQGRYFWNKRTTESLKKAVELFIQATNKDANFARAYSGLADGYMLLGSSEYVGMKPSEAVAKAKEAANKAIALDDTLAEAHASLGFMLYVYDFNWADAEKEFKRAIELNSNYVTAHHWYALYLIVMRRFDESEMQFKKALELDPSSLIINTDYGTLFYFSRRYEQAVTQYKKTLELEPRYVITHWQLGRAYLQQKRYDEAIAEFNQASEIAGRSPVFLTLLGYAYGMSGRREEAEKILRELEAMSKERSVFPHNFMGVYLGLGDKKKAMEYMEQIFATRNPSLVVLGNEPAYDLIRNEPRFQQMLKEMKLNF